ncbi:hypothetical protein IAR50_001878 [Cryptococcus sp. DSM 104548]
MPPRLPIPLPLSHQLCSIRPAQLLRNLSSTASAFERSSSSTERFSQVVRDTRRASPQAESRKRHQAAEAKPPLGKSSQSRSRPLLRPPRSQTPATARSLPPHSSQPSPTPEPSLKAATPEPTRQRSWQPTKKLTYSAMAGLRALYQLDPERFSKSVLSEKFGVSHEAVTRILKSKFREDKNAGGMEALDALQRGLAFGQEEVTGRLEKPSLKGTKWDRNPGTSENVSPVPSIMRAVQEARRGR